MCGKANSADQNTCLYCQARIKPLIKKPFENDLNNSSQPGEIEHDQREDLSGADKNAGSSPDWLNQIRSGLDEPFGQDAGETSQEDALNWINELLNKRSDNEHGLDEDLLAKLDSNQPSVSQISDEKHSNWPADLDDEQLPDWLQESPQTPVEEISGGGINEEIDPEDWMKFAIDGPAEPSSVDANNLDIMDRDSWDSPAPEKEDKSSQLGWLKALEASYPEIPLDEVDGSEAEDAQLTEDLDFSNERLSSWGLEEAHSEDQVEQTKTGDLAPASLPSWLEAMRPFEPHVSSQDSAGVAPITDEGSGPLAGLRGVISAEPDISYIRKPPQSSVKLKISEHQQAHAALLEQLMQSEGIAAPLSKPALIASRSLYRLATALILVLAIILAIVLPELQVASPNLSSFPEAWAVFQLVDRVALERPILFAIDYQPGVSGEMDAVTSAILKHLVSRRAKLIFVATQAMGPMQAERLIYQASQITGVQYLPIQDYANLGFIPGGSAGLLSFVHNPRRTFPAAIDNGSIWQQPPYQNITDISDFSLVVVATENTETARAWIEQAQPNLSGAPLVMAISAQVEPVMAPYYLNTPRQIQGFVSGLASATAYESVSIHPGAALESYIPFSLGGLAAVLLIVIGGGVNIIAPFVLDRKVGEQGRGGKK